MKLDKNTIIALKVLLFCLVVYFPLVMGLDDLVIRLWDESRQAINAFEMYLNGNWLVTTYDGLGDLWNTKPPMLIWMQVICFKLFGPGEFAVRFPSAFAGLLTTGGMVYFFWRYFKEYWMGLLAALILVTSPGYINYHASRTGDYDALIAACTTLYCLFYFVYITKENASNKYLYFTFLFILIGIFSKGVAALFFIPALFLFTFFEDKILHIIKNPHFYIGSAIVVVVTASYYLLREKYNPGYLEAVTINELGGRYFQTIENHSQGFMYFYHTLVNFQFKEWHWLVIPGIISGVLYSQELRKFTWYLVVLFVCFFFIISYSKTKLEWYDVPLMPILSMLASFSLIGFYQLIKKYSAHLPSKNLYLGITVVLILLLPMYQYSNIIRKVYHAKENDSEWEFHQMAYYLREQLDNNTSMQKHVVCFDEYNPHLLFYVKKMNLNHQPVIFKDHRYLLKGDYAIAHKRNIKEFIEKNYAYEVKDKYNDVVNIYLIK